MKNSADLGGCYPPRPSASVDNTLLDLQNSSYPTQPHSIIAKYWPSSFLRVYGRHGVEVHKQEKIKNEASIQAILTEQAWSTKDLLYDIQGIFLAGYSG